MTAHLKLDVVRESDFFVEESEHDIFITGTSFSMPKFDPSTWGRKNLYIQAYDLTLIENIQSPGKVISINTRTLRTPSTITIDVSGGHGAPHTLRANNGRTLGAAGNNGQDGSAGKDAGTIMMHLENHIGQSVTLLAIGGNGAQGQHGGDGQQGPQGRNAKDRITRQSDEGPGKAGERGGKGGDAGRGGKGGKGGNGGTINLELGEAADKTKFISKVTGGKAGLPGENGKPGIGGNGGKGGKGVSCEYEARDHWR
ncbi:hypothetical protein [Rheinheimera sp.]|uniref:hypothetical protein n=1 Tax=Rheinheimera sp. TaxID=1869214 RepID=UPI002734A2F6|nr:hypothetical protein [Rheinheimera sp.]MDP2716433.1 hypothetical protein [Rheinheimera sp.]